MDNYTRYKNLQEQMLQARNDSENQLEDEILDIMDDVWYKLTREERQQLKVERYNNDMA